MARTYTDTWSSNVTATTSPYYIQEGTGTVATASSGKLNLPPNVRYTWDYSECAIVRGTIGNTAASDPLAMKGNCAMQFTINTASLISGQGFSVRATTAAEKYPMLLSTGSAIKLTWNARGFNNAGMSGPSGTGITGQTVSGRGVWTVLFVRKGAQHQVVFTSPSSTTYASGWYPATDDGHVALALYQDYWNYSSSNGTAPISAISIADNLSNDQADAIVSANAIDLTPQPVSDKPTGSYGDVVTVTLSAPAEIDATYTDLRYTLDGTEPTVSSTLYSGPISIGSPYTPGTTNTLKCAYFSGTLGKARTKVLTYTFIVTEPVATCFRATDGTQPYHTRDITLTWQADPTITEYWYTQDGTDPQTSGTAVKWVPGAKYLFNSHPYSSGLQWGVSTNRFNCRAKHAGTGLWSTMSKTYHFYFSLTTDGYPSVKVQGGGNSDATVRWGTYDETLAPVASAVATTVTVNGGTPTVYPSNEGYLDIPFDPSVVTGITVYATSNDGLLRTNTKQISVMFMQRPPVLDKTTIISTGDFATVKVTNPNPSSTVYYTLDGSNPLPSASSSDVASPTSLSSTQSSFTVQVPNGSVLKAFANRGGRSGLYSTLAVADTFREFEVGATATATVDGNSYHYYSATQRCDLNAPLGETTAQIAVGTNVSTASVTGTVDGVQTPIFLWDVADQSGALNKALANLNISDTRSKFWSRLSYTAASIGIDYNFDKTAWMTPNATMAMTGTMAMFRLRLVSAYSAVIFDYVVDCASYATSIYRYNVVHGSNLGTPTIVAGKTLATGTTLNNNLTIAISANTVSLSDGTAISTETLTGSNVGATWSIEGSFNPESVDIPALASVADKFRDTATWQGDDSLLLPMQITTTATNGFLRRSPATVFIETASAYAGKSKTVTFSSRSDVTDADFYVPCGPLKSQASAVYAANINAATITGPFEWKIPGVFDGTGAFDVSVEFNATIDKAAGQDITLYTSVEGYNGSVSGIDLGTAFATLRCVKEVDSNGSDIAGSTALEMYAGGAATRVLAPTAESHFKLRLAKTAGSQSATAYGYVGGVEINLGTVTVQSGAIEFRLTRKGRLSRPSPMHTVIYNASLSGSIRTKTITGAHLSSAYIMRKGSPTLIPATDFTAPVNGVRAVFFNTTTKVVSLEDLSFEPSDGRILVGIIDTRNDQAIWVGLLFSKTVRVRSEVNGVLGAGSIVGAGTDIKASNKTVSWISSGYEQTVTAGSTAWIRPNVFVDLFRKKQVIRTFEKQPIKIVLQQAPTGA